MTVTYNLSIITLTSLQIATNRSCFVLLWSSLFWVAFLIPTCLALLPAFPDLPVFSFLIFLKNKSSTYYEYYFFYFGFLWLFLAFLFNFRAASNSGLKIYFNFQGSFYAIFIPPNRRAMPVPSIPSSHHFFFCFHEGFCYY